METLDEHRLRRLIEVGRVLTSELDLDVVLRRVLHTARELTTARYVAMEILHETRRELERFLTVGDGEETLRRIAELPLGNDAAGGAGFIALPILIRGEAFGNLYLTGKEGSGHFDRADEQAAEVLSGWAAIAIENARLYRRVESRRDELERAVRELEATATVTRAVGDETDLGRVLELIAQRGRALVDARSLVILLQEEQELVIAATAGEANPGSRGTRIPIDSLPASAPEALVQHGVADQVRASLATMLEARTALLVPLEFHGHTHGVLCAFDRTLRGPRFDEEDERLLGTFAASAATAVATARSVERELLRQSIDAQEQERRRFARELHDQTLQGLGGLQVGLSSALQTGSSDRLTSAVREALGQIGGEIEGLREIITDLRPAALDALGPQAALEGLAQRTAAATGLAVELAIDLDFESGRRDTRLVAELENTIYRLVQESLTNAAKHSSAARVRVSVAERRRAVEVAVSDDGVGFDPDAVTRGFGLQGMRERVALANGTLEVQSSPGAGTSVYALLPVQARGAPESAG